MTDYKLHKPSKFGFKNKTRGGHRAYILRDDPENTLQPIYGVIVEFEKIVETLWASNGLFSCLTREFTDYDLIPLEEKLKKHKYKIGQWYPWNGGERPVPKDSRVMFLNEVGVKSDGTAGKLEWLQDYTGIVAFKVVSYD